MEYKKLLGNIYEQLKEKKFIIRKINNNKNLPDKIDIKEELLIFINWIYEKSFNGSYSKTILDYLVIPMPYYNKIFKDLEDYIEHFSYVKYEFKNHTITLNDNIDIEKEKEEIIINLEKMKIKQLKEECKKNGFESNINLKKQEYINCLNNKTVLRQKKIKIKLTKEMKQKNRDIKKIKDLINKYKCDKEVIDIIKDEINIEK